MENPISPNSESPSDVNPIGDTKLVVSNQSLQETVQGLTLRSVDTMEKIVTVSEANGVNDIVTDNETSFCDAFSNVKTEVLFVKDNDSISNNKIFQNTILKVQKQTQCVNGGGAIPKTTKYKKTKEHKNSENEYRTLLDKSRNHSNRDSSSDDTTTIMINTALKCDKPDHFGIEGIKLMPSNKGTSITESTQCQSGSEIQLLDAATCYMLDSDADETEVVYFAGNRNAYSSQGVSNTDAENTSEMPSSVAAKSSSADDSDSSSTDDESYTLLSILFRNRLKSIEKQFKNINAYLWNADILVTGKSDLEFIFKKMKFDIQSLENYLFNPNLHITKPKVKTLQTQLRKILALNIRIRNKVYVKRSTATYALKQLDMKPQEPKISSQNYNWTMSNMKNVHIFLRRDEVNDKVISFNKMKTTLIEIQGNPKSMYLKNLNDCMLICGPVTGTIYFEKCIESIFVVAGKEMRLKNSEVCYLYSHVTNCISLENSRRIIIGVYENDYPLIDVDIKNASLNMDCNNNTNVDDFGWNAETYGQSANWTALEYSDTPSVKEMKIKILDNIKIKIKDLEV